MDLFGCIDVNDARGFHYFTLINIVLNIIIFVVLAIFAILIKSALPILLIRMVY
jgi:hypothetical protein